MAIRHAFVRRSFPYFSPSARIELYELQVLIYIIVYLGSLLELSLDVLFIAAMMTRELVRFLCRVLIWSIITLMSGHDAQVVVNLYRVIIVDYLHALTDIFGRHAVVMLEECKVAVASYGQHLALLHRITLRRQGTQTFLFYLKKTLATAVGRSDIFLSLNASNAFIISLLREVRLWNSRFSTAG